VCHRGSRRPPARRPPRRGLQAPPPRYPYPPSNDRQTSDGAWTMSTSLSGPWPIARSPVSGWTAPDWPLRREMWFVARATRRRSATGSRTSPPWARPSMPSRAPSNRSPPRQTMPWPRTRPRSGTRARAITPCCASVMSCAAACWQMDALVDRYHHCSVQPCNRSQQWHDPEALEELLTRRGTGRPRHVLTRRQSGHLSRTRVRVDHTGGTVTASTAWRTVAKTWCSPS
jgi:hypothetical protein